MCLRGTAQDVAAITVFPVRCDAVWLWHHSNNDQGRASAAICWT